MICHQFLAVINVVVDVETGSDKASQEKGEEWQLTDNGSPTSDLTIFESEALNAGVENCWTNVSRFSLGHGHSSLTVYE